MISAPRRFSARALLALALALALPAAAEAAVIPSVGGGTLAATDDGATDSIKLATNGTTHTVGGLPYTVNEVNPS